MKFYYELDLIEAVTQSIQKQSTNANANSLSCLGSCSCQKLQDWCKLLQSLIYTKLKYIHDHSILLDCKQ